FAQQITPDPGGSALTSGLGGRPLQARRLHVSSHMGPYTHYPHEMPYNVTAVPITYSGRDGRQYVAVTAARSGRGTAPSGDEGLFVFALPR
ncbi:MAG: hypothetical protein WBE98_15890, partial [Gammaproteobacteria bacterium]